HYCLWGGCWFLLFLLPSLVISFLKHEYRLYLPMIGVIILLLETGPVRSLAEHPKRATTVLVIILTVFAIITFQYSDQFKDRFTFWHSAVKTSPHSPLAHRNLGAMYHLNGEIDKAETSYRRSFALDPREPMVQNNLGLIYAKRGLLKQAEDAYKGEIAVNPLYSNVHFNLGILYYNQGEIEQAVELWERTLELDPQYIEAYKYLAVHSFDTGNSQKTSYYVDQLKTRGIPVSKEIIKELEVGNR
ncbi:MAG: tetratricopeptide repeat protein, partial [Candidatus Omnitrophica bacterium]|nr:tetratricopeptide repeat protein [Candidatus Omnitrophota bacterium]